MKKATWLHTYENWNVEVGVDTGVYSVGQIGKGMWTMPDLMKTMYNTKTNHPQAGANTAWVPSPTLSVVHALHYHEINVLSIQRTIGSRVKAKLDDILSPPVLREELSPKQIETELENNAQSILGYVVHWVEEGIGCSKIADINEINLMEDRATLRISSQLIASWLKHGLTTREQVVDIFKRIAVIVDKQNEGAAGYRKMAPNYDSSVGFQAALDLVFQGIDSPNGYTEPILHARRSEAKALYSS
jgi:malate synthase